MRGRGRGRRDGRRRCGRPSVACHGGQSAATWLRRRAKLTLEILGQRRVFKHEFHQRMAEPPRVGGWRCVRRNAGPSLCVLPARGQMGSGDSGGWKVRGRRGRRAGSDDWRAIGMRV